MSAAAFYAGRITPEGLHPRDTRAAGRAAIVVPPGDLPTRERQFVGAFFIGQPQIFASAAPFRAMRVNAPPAGAHVGEQVRQFVPEGARDFLGAKFS